MVAVKTQPINLDIIKCLVEHGANINQEKTGIGHHTVLTTAAIERESLPAVKYLVEHGAKVNKIDGEGLTALGYACYQGDLSMVEYLVANKADVNKGKPPLVAAILHLPVMEYLIANGAKLSSLHEKDSAGYTALMCVVKQGHLPMTKYLVENQGCKLDGRTIKGETVFDLARGCKDKTQGQAVLEYLNEIQAKHIATGINSPSTSTGFFGFFAKWGSTSSPPSTSNATANISMPAQQTHQSPVEIQKPNVIPSANSNNKESITPMMKPSIAASTVPSVSKLVTPQTVNAITTPIKLIATAAPEKPAKPLKPPKLTSSTSQPQTQATLLPTQTVLDNSLLTDPTLNHHLIFLSTLPQESLTALETLGKHGANLNNMLPTLTTLKTNQENLTQRLEAVETQTGLDAQTLAEISYIQKNESLNRYYQTLKMLLGQTFLAAKVISSGEVDATQGTSVTVANGISNVAGALCPPAAPFLSFAATVVGIADGIASYRAMQTLSGWVDISVIERLAARVAQELAIAQEHHLQRGLTQQGKKTFKYIQDKCTLVIERIQSGKTLTLEESHALLDANELLNYMKENKKPQKASLSECVAILLTVIMGEDYTHTSTHIIAVQQTSVTNTATTIINVTATSQSHVITREEWEAMQKEIAESKKEAAQANQKLAALDKQSTQSNPTSSHIVGDGPLVSVQSQEAILNSAQGPMPVSAVVQHQQTRLDNLEKTMSIIGPQWLEFQEQQRRGNSSAKNNTINDDKARSELFKNETGYYSQHSFDPT